MLLSHLFESIETRPAAEVWDEVSASSASYVPSTVYLVKPSDKKRGEFDVYTDEQNKRTLYATMSSDDLKDSLEQVRSDDKPDAEGYVMYRARETLDAVKYTGDPVNISNDTGVPVRLSKNDWLVRTTEGDNFVFSVEPDSFFSRKYTKV